MKTPKFDFKKHQNYQKSWKMLVRFIIYGAVISFLMYLIFFTEKASPEPTNDASEKYYEVDIIEPQSE
ncbi:hypothetical protein CW751_00970 [Brumimicrobium salinarum]|uniref:Uncharacterized protein n=1 Tax=Brumimicrobium salinarum TaxID=2058658 RepID=A0A2I0R5U9_9FLAO|nr:hypothetical protein [Brumimicrobium salinarum]PKR81939.1 hypothetical protein CW751_00970 [Brumimicrobium salinarum]